MSLVSPCPSHVICGAISSSDDLPFCFKTLTDFNPVRVDYCNARARRNTLRACSALRSAFFLFFTLQDEPTAANVKTYAGFNSKPEYAADSGKTGPRPASWYLPPLGADLSTDAWAATAGMAPDDPIFPAGSQALPPAVCCAPRALACARARLFCAAAALPPACSARPAARSTSPSSRARPCRARGRPRAPARLARGAARPGCSRSRFPSSRTTSAYARSERGRRVSRASARRVRCPTYPRALPLPRSVSFS